MKSYVWHGEDCFFVSTINRDSSAPYGTRYAETLVWLFDWERQERLPGLLLQGDSSHEGGITGHIATCEKLHKYGADWPEEDAHFPFPTPDPRA